MLQAKATLNANGRLVIPAAARKALGLGPGDELILRVEDGELRLSTRRQALSRVPRMIRQYIPADVDLTRSLIDDRREEARRE